MSLKITIIYQYFGTPRGSWSTRVYEMATRWLNEGHEVKVITSPYYKSDIRTSKFIEKQVVDGIQLIIINSPDDNKKGILKRVFNSISFAVISTYYALSDKSDVFIASSGPITVGIPMLFKKIFSKAKIVFEVRDLWPGGAVDLGLIKSKTLIYFGFLFEKICYRSANLVVSASEGQYRDINARVRNLNHILVPNASDIKLFERLDSTYQFPNWVNGKMVFLHTGSIGLMNNCSLIVEAAKYIRDNYPEVAQKIVIVFIGDGAEKELVKNLAEEYQLDFIRFMGLIPKFDLVNWVSISTSTILTALDNKFMDTLSPNKVYDSFAAGKPIIQTTKGWIRDLFEENNCGLNVDCTPESLGRAIIELSNNEKDVKLMSDNSKKLAKTVFNRDILAKRYIDAITDI